MTAPPKRRPRCVIVGPPGAGKSTVGCVSSRKPSECRSGTRTPTSWRRVGKPISDIFVDDGEDAFRALERDAVAAALASFDGVLALGGGAILAESTRALLRGHTVVFLSVELSDAVSRVGLGAGRPLLTVNPRATLKYLLDQRRPLYEEVATVTVRTDGRKPADIAAEVLGAIA